MKVRVCIGDKFINSGNKVISTIASIDKGTNTILFNQSLNDEKLSNITLSFKQVAYLLSDKTLSKVN